MENRHPNNQLAGALFLPNPFLGDPSIYKSWDTRCLAPNSHSNPSKWRTYNMTAFRAASNKGMLNSVGTFKYDKNFNNWIDPEVLKTFAKSSLNTIWGNSYDFSHLVFLNHAKCERQCRKNIKKGKFLRKANMTSSFQDKKDCRKDGGSLNCCANTWKLDTIEKSRNRLIAEGLI